MTAARSPTLLTSPATGHVDGSLVAPFGSVPGLGADPKTRIRISCQVPLAKTGDAYDARTWDQFPAQTESVASRVPWMLAVGNHGMEARYSRNGYGGQEARWTLPVNGPDPSILPGVYSFTYGNVAVISVEWSGCAAPVLVPHRRDGARGGRAHDELRVSAPAENGERIDHFTVARKAR